MIKEKICGSVYGLVPPKINIYSLIQFQAEVVAGGAAEGMKVIYGGEQCLTHGPGSSISTSSSDGDCRGGGR